MLSKLREKRWHVFLGLLLALALCVSAPFLLNPYFLFVTVSAYLYLLAFASLGGLACGIYLWRKKRRLSLSLLLVSVAYLAFYLHFFIFHQSNSPRSTLTIDLRKPTDLSGIPANIAWISNSWPPPKFVDPLAASGSSCEADGKVDLTLVLPDGYVLHEVATRVVIETKTAGIWQVFIEAFGVEPKVALEDFEHNIWPLALRPENRYITAQERSEIQNRLETFDSKTSADLGFVLTYPAYRLQLGMRNISVWNPIIFGPSNRVLYTYYITLPQAGR